MKTAQKINGQPVLASASAPHQAICPYCGGQVVLRQRQLMNQGGVVYYWRHRENHNLRCSGRTRPVT